MFRLGPWVHFFHYDIAVMRTHRTLMARYLSNVDLVHVVDLEVIKTWTSMLSETSWTCDSFRNKLLERDVRCLWTGLVNYGAGLHIIPYKRGSEVRSTIFWEDV
jgi:hypothetical protein